MIVCQCHVVNDREIARAVDAGARTVSRVSLVTGAGRDCGSCVLSLKRLICEREGAASESLPEENREAS